MTLGNWFVSVIPQTCTYKGTTFDCGLSISCVLGGGRPVDLCSGGLIWSCCVDDDDIPDKVPRPTIGLLQNASEFLPALFSIFFFFNSTMISYVEYQINLSINSSFLNFENILLKDNI